jgi:FixJ family two-component response regulator
MASRQYIHVIDSNTRRRAQIAYELTNRNLHTEIYESLDEFRDRGPTDGYILLCDDFAGCSLSALKAVLAPAGHVLPVAVYSDEPVEQKVVAAMIEGAVDYLRWPFVEPLLEGALERLADVGVRHAGEQRRAQAAKAAVQELSDRELEVLQLMTLGFSNKQVAAELGISPRTVEIHRGNMMRKLNARSPFDAARLAIWAGLDAELDERLAA